MENRKRRFGDTKSSYLVRGLDPLHMVMPIMMGSRTDNETVVQFEFNCEKLDKYLEEKNSKRDPDTPKYTYLHAVSAAFFRTVEAKPILNRFIKRERLYDRKDISVAFMAKRQLTEGSEEALIVAKYDKDSTKPVIDIVHDKVCKQVDSLRKTNKTGGTDNLVRFLSLLPRPLFWLLVKILCWADSFDWLPKDITNSLPYSSTIFISNLGSLKLNASYHHLINFGSNSLFLIMGTKHKTPEFHEDGTFKLINTIPFSFTLDERISDGIYYGNSLKLFCKILNNPHILDKPACEKIDYDSLPE